MGAFGMSVSIATVSTEPSVPACSAFKMASALLPLTGAKYDNFKRHYSVCYLKNFFALSTNDFETGFPESPQASAKDSSFSF